MQPITVKHSTLDLGIVGLRPQAILADSAGTLPKLSTLRITWTSRALDARSVVAQASITNTGSAPVTLAGIRWSYDPALGHVGPALHFPTALQPLVWANENLRSEYFGTGTVEGNQFAYPLTNQTVEYGAGEEHLFPGLFIGATHQPLGVLIAQASQNKLYPLIRFRGRAENRENWLLEFEERSNGSPVIELQPGQELAGEHLFIAVLTTNDPHQATAGYFKLLHDQGAFARLEHNPLPTQRIYCTWNYDFFADIDEEKTLGQIPALKKHFPTVKFLQLDDGYQTEHAPKQRAMIDLCYGDFAERAFDPRKFPGGPKNLCAQVRSHGLRPAIWLGLWASLGSRMLKDHPDWILRDDTGSILQFESWYGGVAILDPSHPGVLDYLDRMCRIVFRDWGFEGVKLDFSSFGLNGKRVRYSHPSRSGVELRHQIETIFRRHLPPDGFFGWCVVAGTSQVFLNQADYFRNAVDIDKGRWSTVLRIARWTANTNLFLSERTCLPNLDSIGWSKELDETTWQTWLNFAAVSSGVMEVSGDLRKLSDDRLKKLARTMELSDLRRSVRCLDLPRGAAELPPSLWLAQGKAGAKLLGVFNWGEQTSAIAIAAELQGKSARDAWTGARVSVPASLELKSHDSVLWEIE